MTWRPVPGYENVYRISDTGEAWSEPRPGTRGGLLKPHPAKRGSYPVVNLVKDGRQWTAPIHKLVALAFLGEPAEGLEVRHIDGDPANNALTNISYGSRAENRRDRIRHGRDHNVNKTHCLQGHEYSPNNILRVPSRPTARYCRACNVQRKRDRRRQEWT